MYHEGDVFENNDDEKFEVACNHGMATALKARSHVELIATLSGNADNPNIRYLRYLRNICV